MARLSREAIITEKIDGTNGQIFITSEFPTDVLVSHVLDEWDDGLHYWMFAGSRTKWVKPGDDNAGFAGWVKANSLELRQLGEGRHFGEWWGKGIQRGYGLNEKRFSLFNVSRWSTSRPLCCHVVPTLFTGTFDTGLVKLELMNLRSRGSVAAPGYMNPEGVVVWHVAGNVGFKKTLDKDDQPKGLINV